MALRISTDRSLLCEIFAIAWLLHEVHSTTFEVICQRKGLKKARYRLFSLGKDRHFSRKIRRSTAGLAREAALQYRRFCKILPLQKKRILRCVVRVGRRRSVTPVAGARRRRSTSAESVEDFYFLLLRIIRIYDRVRSKETMPSPMEGVLGEGRVATGSGLPNALPHAFPGLLGRVGRNDPPDFLCGRGTVSREGPRRTSRA